MKVHKFPKTDQWQELTQRPVMPKKTLDNIVQDILNNVKTDKDDALYKYTEEFDGVRLSQIAVTPSEVNTAKACIPTDLKTAIEIAKKNITTFHQSQQQQEAIVETVPGVTCWRKSVGIEKVGLYIPGGSAPLFSTILMLGIPAKIAGCQEIILCTPPDKEGKIHPAILYTADLVGVHKIYKVGGAQAIAAMAYGTESIPKVYKIFGPGNQFVTKAKEMVQRDGVAIDMPAGPSEVLIIADASGNPEFIAADLLSQAEHGADSQVILLSDEVTMIDKVITEIEKQLAHLPRKTIAEQALTNSRAIVMHAIDEAIAFSNKYAPEHLIIASEQAETYLDRISNAGSVFVGNYSCESAGDYASGTNHTLPTNGYAKNYSGVSLDSFVKKITFQKLDSEGIKSIGKAIETMAEAEALMAHKNAVSVRLKSLSHV